MAHTFSKEQYAGSWTLVICNASRKPANGNETDLRSSSSECFRIGMLIPVDMSEQKRFDVLRS